MEYYLVNKCESFPNPKIAEHVDVSLMAPEC